MRLLYAIAECYPTYRADVAVLFGKYLPRHGVKSDIHALHAPDAELPQWSGGDLQTLPAGTGRIAKHMRTFFNDLRLLWLARRGYDAVQVRDKALCGLIGLVAARLAGIPFFYWMSFPMVEAWAEFARARHGSVSWGRWVFALLRARVGAYLLYRLVLRHADHVFVQSEQMLAEVAAKGISAQKMTAVPMGVDMESAPQASDLVGEDEFAELLATRPAFVYLGTLNAPRHPELMIAAMDILRVIHPEAYLLLIGDAEEASDRTRLDALIAELGLQDHVRITGWVPMAQGWAWARRCRAGLSPFPRSALLESASPTKAVEYYALGLPVVANDQPDQARVVAGAGGMCVPLSAEGFAAAMVGVLAQSEAWQAQARAGRAYVQAERSYAVLGERLAACYGRLVRR